MCVCCFACDADARYRTEHVCFLVLFSVFLHMVLNIYTLFFFCTHDGGFSPIERIPVRFGKDVHGPQTTILSCSV